MYDLKASHSNCLTISSPSWQHILRHFNKWSRRLSYSTFYHFPDTMSIRYVMPLPSLSWFCAIRSSMSYSTNHQQLLYLGSPGLLGLHSAVWTRCRDLLLRGPLGSIQHTCFSFAWEELQDIRGKSQKMSKGRPVIYREKMFLLHPKRLALIVGISDQACSSYFLVHSCGTGKAGKRQTGGRKLERSVKSFTTSEHNIYHQIGCVSKNMHHQ